MNLSQKQLEIIGKQGWNDVTVSNLALQFIADRFENKFTNFLTQIADAENGAKETKEREKLTDKFWKAIEEDSSQALGEAVLFLLEKFPSDKLKEVVDEWVRRLYSCAIADATTAIKEMRENGDWEKEFSNTILDMERKIYIWKTQVHLLSK